MKIIKRRFKSHKEEDPPQFIIPSMNSVNIIEHRYSNSFVYFLEHVDSSFRETLRHTSPDNLCDSLFDPIIDAHVNEQILFAKQIFETSLDSIITSAAKAEGERAALEAKKEMLTEQLNKCKLKLEEFETKYNYDGVI